MSDFQSTTAALLAFRNARDWEQFHNPKDLAAALSVEAGELLELFLWRDAGAADEEKVADELADVISYALLLAHHYGLDPGAIVRDKIRRNEERYPVDRARGRADKHDELTSP